MFPRSPHPKPGSIEVTGRVMRYYGHSGDDRRLDEDRRRGFLKIASATYDVQKLAGEAPSPSCSILRPRRSGDRLARRYP